MEMDSTVAAAKKTLLFGDLTKFKIREVGNIRLKRLVERFAEFGPGGVHRLHGGRQRPDRRRHASGEVPAAARLVALSLRESGGFP